MGARTGGLMKVRSLNNWWAYTVKSLLVNHFRPAMVKFTQFGSHSVLLASSVRCCEPFDPRRTVVRLQRFHCKHNRKEREAISFTTSAIRYRSNVIKYSEQ